MPRSTGTCLRQVLFTYRYIYTCSSIKQICYRVVRRRVGLLGPEATHGPPAPPSVRGSRGGDHWQSGQQQQQQCPHSTRLAARRSAWRRRRSAATAHETEAGGVALLISGAHHAPICAAGALRRQSGSAAFVGAGSNAGAAKA
eukprot:SAG31_NODE_2053_length_6551_cov_7.496125_9_plen_143_part_00